MAHRTIVALDIQMGLGLPLLVVLPLALLAIILAVRFSLDPLRRLRTRLEARGARDLSEVPAGDLPTEIGPLADTLKSLLARLCDVFVAERSFSANAAHERRAQRATDIEATLKRLTRRTERLMQLARAEGRRLQSETAHDARAVLRIVVEDMARGSGIPDITLDLPETPFLSTINPDALGIVCRNLVENARRHGAAGTPVDVTLMPDGQFIVSNDGPVLPPDTLARLTARFERAGARADGSGLGLAIVAAIADRIGSPLVLRSPRPGAVAGFEARFQSPVDVLSVPG